MLAEVDDRGVVGQRVADQLLRRVGQHDLAAVRGRGDARAAVHRRSVVVAVAVLGGPRMESHADS